MGRHKTIESKLVAISLQKHKGNQSACAKELGVSRAAIGKRIKTDPIVRSAWKKYVDSLNRIVPHKKSIRVIAEAMEAGKEYRRITGEIVATSPDHKTRLAANEQYLKISKLLDEKENKEPEKHLHRHLKDKTSDELFSFIMSHLAEREAREREMPKFPIIPCEPIRESL